MVLSILETMLSTLFALAAFRVRDLGEVEGGMTEVEAEVGGAGVRVDGKEKERDLLAISCIIL